MKRSLHPGAVAAIVAALVVVTGTIFVRLGDGSAARSETASPYTKIGEHPTSPGSGVNSLTGEPLSETAKAYEASSFAQKSGAAGKPR